MNKINAHLFWAKVDKSADCWIWTASRTKDGYGWFRIGSRRDRTDTPALAHRVAWEIANGPPPAGTSVLHRCDNPGCVRPDHLFVGTQADNMLDMSSKDRAPNKKLTRPSVREMRELAAAGVPVSELAARFMVGRSTADKAIKGKTWRFA
jgi:hypothetical protein